jgi:hypothetical protein
MGVPLFRSSLGSGFRLYLLFFVLRQAQDDKKEKDIASIPHASIPQKEIRCKYKAKLSILTSSLSNLEMLIQYLITKSLVYLFTY